MFSYRPFLLVVVVQMIVSPDGLAQTQRTEVEPPVARVIPHTLTEHGHSRVDNYFWLRDNDDGSLTKINYGKFDEYLPVAGDWDGS